MATKAKESKQVRRYRKKLEKVLEEEHKHFNVETLREVRKNIHKWIARHEPDRISIKSKTFTLFDENKHPSEVKSKFVQHMLHDLQNSAREEERSKLAGRVTYNKS